MEVLAASVEHFDNHFANSPGVKLVVDRLPSLETMRWRRWPTRSEPDSVVAHASGFCYVGRALETPEYHRYFFGDPERPGRGFGGRKFTVTMEDGEEHSVTGPGAGGPYLVLPSSGIALCEAAVAERDGPYPDLYYAGCGFPPEFVANALRLAPPPDGFNSNFGWALASLCTRHFRLEPVLVKGRENFGSLLSASHPS